MNTSRERLEELVKDVAIIDEAAVGLLREYLDAIGWKMAEIEIPPMQNTMPTKYHQPLFFPYNVFYSTSTDEPVALEVLLQTNYWFVLGNEIVTLEFEPTFMEDEMAISKISKLIMPIMRKNRVSCEEVEKMFELMEKV